MRQQNRDKAADLENALDSLYSPGTRANVVRALRDLRHLCDRVGLDFGQLDREAYGYYLTDKRPDVVEDVRL